MSIAVGNYPSTTYRQTPVAWPVNLFAAPKIKPCGVMLNFNWTVYYALFNPVAANIGVDVDLNSGGTSQGGTIDKIVSAKIDNSNSNVPILIYFPDSGDVVSCPPQTIATLPCTTNGTLCKVIAQGLSAGNLPLTSIVFYNYFIPPSIDPVVQLVFPQWLGSPTIQRDALLTSGFGAPALGDQLISARTTWTQVANPESVILAAATGFYYITAIYLQCYHFSVTFAAANGHAELIGRFVDNTGSVLTEFGAYVDARILGAASLQGVAGNFTMINIGPTNSRFNANRSFKIQFVGFNDGGTGATAFDFEMQTLVSYSLNPN